MGLIHGSSIEMSEFPGGNGDRTVTSVNAMRNQDESFCRILEIRLVTVQLKRAVFDETLDVIPAIMTHRTAFECAMYKIHVKILAHCRSSFIDCSFSQCKADRRVQLIGHHGFHNEFIETKCFIIILINFCTEAGHQHRRQIRLYFMDFFN